MLNQDMIREATRLTRGGQLAEAAALLQRMFRNGQPKTESPAAGDLLLSSQAPPEINREANAEAPAMTSATMTLRSRPSLNRAKDGTWLGLRGVNRVPVVPTDLVPPGAKFIDGTYRNEAGVRDYKLFVPSNYSGRPLPLIVMLHGCTQSPDDFAAGTRMNLIAEQHSCLVVYPAQSKQANQSGCWNWFQTAHQFRDEGEPSLIAGITRKIIKDYSVDPQRVFVAGLSAGGAAAATMGAIYGDLYAAVGIHSGLAYGAAADMPSAFAAMRQGGSGHRPFTTGTKKPTIIFHGNNDSTVHPKNGVLASQQVLGTTATQKIVHRGQVQVPGGRKYTRTVHVDADNELLEYWEIHGAGHAWSGGSPAGSYTDQQGPDASGEMLRFFLSHAKKV
jgi:poly(hydroxyalkanoate) depolymerase family esterase